MSGMTTTKPAPSADAQQDDHAVAVSAIQDISVAVATGLVPFLGQAINIYDTVDCILTLHNSNTPEATMEAKFDLVLALVGWIPGAGGGVKKTIRIVNKHPERYAPILFDVLRIVCEKIGIHTSPEVLLDELFDAVGLKKQLDTIQSAIEGSWLYKEMPSEGRLALSAGMSAVRAQLPAMVMLVTVKLTHWKTKQRNNAAHVVGVEGKIKPTETKPNKKDPKVAEAGTNAPNRTTTRNTLNATIGTTAIEEITKTLTGIYGEHITDYFLYENYGWGKDWKGHDDGTAGEWKTKPGKEFPGKLNEATKLNKLFALQAHGTGIDGVWKVQLGDPHNGGKPYAIVESKASVAAHQPKNASAKPNVANKLGDNAKRIKDAVAPKPEELLEPATDDTTQTAPKPTGGQAGRPGRPGRSGVSPTSTSTSNGSSLPKSNASSEIIVQMSRTWILKNIKSAVGHVLAEDVKRKGYSRHLFYTPWYLPSAAQHIKALVDAEPTKHESHSDHDIPSTHRHDENEVIAAVNHKHAKLGLKAES